MKQITLKVKDSYYNKLVQYLRSLTYVEIDSTDGQSIQIIEEQPNSQSKKKKFTVINVAAVDRNYIFNREELNER